MGIQDLFDNSSVRRQDRSLEIGRATEILEDSEYGSLALGGGDAYGIPLNYVHREGSLYFHCAPGGEKLERVGEGCSACFCIVGHTLPLPARFTTEYESIIAFGHISQVVNDEERMEALMLIVAKYSAEFMDTGRKYAGKSFGRTAILRLDIERISGKTKQVDKVPDSPVE